MKRPDLPAEHCANQSVEEVRRMFVRHIAPELKTGSINARRAISELQTWREYHPEAFDDWEQLCWTYIEQPPQWVDWLIAGVKATSDKVTKADELVAAAKAEQRATAALDLAGTFAQAGDNQYTVPSGGDNVTTYKANDTGKGNSAAYLAARLKKAGRDDLLRQIGPDKPFQSIRAAAIEAGIIKDIPSIQLKDPGPTAQKLLAKKGQAWCLQLMEELSELIL